MTIAAPFETSHLSRLLADTKAVAEIEGEARITIGGTTFKLKKQFFDDLERTHMQHTIASLNRALLVMHSPADKTIPIENSLEIFAPARHPKSFVSLDNATHVLSEQQELVVCRRGYCGVGQPVAAPAGDVSGVDRAAHNGAVNVRPHGRKGIDQLEMAEGGQGDQAAVVAGRACRDAIALA